MEFNVAFQEFVSKGSQYKCLSPSQTTAKLLIEAYVGLEELIVVAINYIIS